MKSGGIVRRAGDVWLIEGFAWFVFPTRSRDAARGLVAHFQDRTCRLPHWSDCTDQDTSACVVADCRENGLLIVTTTSTPPSLPDGWQSREGELPKDWSHHDSSYSIWFLGATGDDQPRSVFEARSTGQDART